jgi:hypothetical protein
MIKPFYGEYPITQTFDEHNAARISHGWLYYNGGVDWGIPVGTEMVACLDGEIATVTNDTLVPVPDYVEYQDQAEELDNLRRELRNAELWRDYYRAKWLGLLAVPEPEHPDDAMAREVNP